MRRRLTILTHWLNLVLLLLLVAGGLNPALGWAYVLSAGVMCALALGAGLMNGPGPKLDGLGRAAHPWLSRAMYVGLAISAPITALALLGRWSGMPLTPAEIWFYMLSAASLHAVFHLWRHTALSDGALRRITPRALHGIL